MKTILQFLFALASAGMAWAQTQIVVPGGLENVEGNSSSSDLFINGVAHMVQVYSADEFDSISAPLLRIDGVAFRMESGTGTRLGSWNINIGLGSTQRSPDSLSPVFGENLGQDSIAVRTGQWGFLARNDDGNPRPFDVGIRFDTPFYYDPSKGNLALTIIAFGTRSPLILDAESTTGDGVGRVFGPNALSGTIDSLGLVTRFDITPIPEPSSMAILGLGTITLFLASRGSLNRAKNRLY